MNNVKTDSFICFIVTTDISERVKYEVENLRSTFSKIRVVTLAKYVVLELTDFEVFED